MATDSCDGWTSGGVVARDFVNGRDPAITGRDSTQVSNTPKFTITESIYYISRKNLEATNRHYSGL